MEIYLSIIDASESNESSAINCANMIVNEITNLTIRESHITITERDGKLGFDLKINLNGESAGNCSRTKRIFDIISKDICDNRGKNKVYNCYFRKDDIPAAVQNKTIESMAGKIHKTLVGNMDYVNSAILLNYSTANNPGPTSEPTATLYFNLKECEVTSDEKINEVINIMSDTVTALCNY